MNEKGQRLRWPFSFIFIPQQPNLVLALLRMRDRRADRAFPIALIAGVAVAQRSAQRQEVSEVQLALLYQPFVAQSHRLTRM
ncbi:MAG: hypothetical protein HYR56_08950 [Acidobacteria bacterium]|nr:hypothetical protein [Acidobacteriota bacterium]MBI3424782.1 hypothetical protein [Acidobacteriota bacterium]